jgi:hypothetical protein
MKVPRGLTVKQLQNQISHLRPEDRATTTERAKARRDLMRRCPYLVAPKKK